MSKRLCIKKAEFLMNKSRAVLQKYSSERVPVYGLNTQFGSQVNILDANITNGTRQYNHSLEERQLNLIKSHNCGLGEEMPQEVVRAAMFLRAHCLSLGYSGVRPAVARALIEFLNKGVHPVIRRYGSIGASGDLIPLSAVAAALIGEKTPVYYRGKKMDALSALKLAGLKKFVPEGREGLALINGTSFMTAIAALAVCDLQRLFFQTLSAVAMSLE
ncbi:MAG: aromatic amino acid ammonia-lyase, partial [Patescibacteria group bacterium]